jgi:hypothetical protein
MHWQIALVLVTPAKAGVQEFEKSIKVLDSGVRRNDGKPNPETSCEVVNA